LVDNGKGEYVYTPNDTKYIIIAITVTTKRFGPSGSLKNANIILEQTREVMPRIRSENIGRVYRNGGENAV
jgi:hypothetical protein